MPHTCQVDYTRYNWPESVCRPSRTFGTEQLLIASSGLMVLAAQGGACQMLVGGWYHKQRRAWILLVHQWARSMLKLTIQVCSCIVKQEWELHIDHVLELLDRCASEG
jgi:hypothetical protein